MVVSVINIYCIVEPMSVNTLDHNDEVAAHGMVQLEVKDGLIVINPRSAGSVRTIRARRC